VNLKTVSASVLLAFGLLLPALTLPVTNAAGRAFIRISKDGRHFVHADTGARFTPWGFNYDHDRSNRLLETYWHQEWHAVESDFAEMKQMGANVVRVHLQLAQFMKAANEPDQKSLAQLARLLKLAEKTGLYLDVTGLGCYDKQAVPSWYNQLDEPERWAVQARFWDAVARTCQSSVMVFCYDLMNEPILTEDRKQRDWTPGAFGDRYFVQRLTLDFAGRSPRQIADAWISKMVTAIRRQDRRHLITIGAIPWAMVWTNARPVFEANTNLDFVSLHFYPKRGAVTQALTALKVYDLGKPIVIEEMFPLSCSVAELDQFIDGSRSLAAGWLGFYWGKTIAEHKSKTDSIAEGLTLDWLEYFVRKAPEILGPTAGPPVRSRPVQK